MHEHAYIYIYIDIRMSEYIEYKVDTFGLQKHLLESVKKPIHRKKASPGIEEEKKTIHRIFPAIHFVLKK